MINTEKATFEPKVRQRQASPKGFVAESIASSIAAANITANSWAFQPEGMAAAGPAPVPGQHPDSWPSGLVLAGPFGTVLERVWEEV